MKLPGLRGCASWTAKSWGKSGGVGRRGLRRTSRQVSATTPTAPWSGSFFADARGHLTEFAGSQKLGAAFSSISWLWLGAYLDLNGTTFEGLLCGGSAAFCASTNQV